MKNLCDFIARTLSVATTEVTPDTGPLTLSAWDSFKHMHLMVSLEEAYEVEIAIEEAVTLLTVSDIARLLDQKGVRIE